MHASRIQFITRWYLDIHDPPEGDTSVPLQLLARSVGFTDPGQARHFESRRRLAGACA
ncbi:hypothetical protein [Xylophilus sp. ASV27]|uniref:hypothetical protein n=1 Tax=Xylophilus sp. ASV27 TaxID=2795129 RepID=UPI0018EB5A15